MENTSENRTALQNDVGLPIALTFELQPINSSLAHCIITIPSSLVDALYHEAALTQQSSVQTHGFSQGEVPISYIQQNFKTNLVEHLKELLFKFAVINFLYREIREKKLPITTDPRLMDIKLEPGSDACFKFECSVSPILMIHEWKYLPFKAPKRKNYKDIDRQVETFVQHERSCLSDMKDDALAMGDWVAFDISLESDTYNSLLKNFRQKFWFKIGDEEIESPIRDLFIGKKLKDTFTTDNKGLQDFFSDQLDTNYKFSIHITEVLPDKYFCFDLFKRHFRIKTNKDLHKKLIEVFSYRNDVSLRRSMVEESLKLLLSKHRFSIPNSLILRQQKVIMDAVQENPDYNVYRMERDFLDYVNQLAEKQTRESIFIDQLAYHENIDVSDHDVHGYLNFMQRPRMKEFVYFDMPLFKNHGHEIPIPSEEIKRICLREKTANQVIYHLTRK